MRRALRALLVLVAALACVPLGAAVGTGTVAVADGCGARAVVIVDTGNGVNRSTVCFGGTISGLDALQLAGANPVTYGFSGQGAAVCALYGVGNPGDQSCLQGPGGAYWAYYRAGPGASGWTYSRGGAGGTAVTDGSVEGWRYGTGQAPPFSSFCDVAGCAPPPAPPTAAPTPAAGQTDPGAVDPGSSGGGTAGSGGAAGPGATGSVGGADGATATSVPGASPPATVAPSTTRAGSGPGTGVDRKDGSRQARELAAGNTGGGSDDGGSPVGVIIAAGALAVVAATAIWLRKRRGGVPSG